MSGAIIKLVTLDSMRALHQADVLCENFGSLCGFDFKMSILSLSTLIGFPLDVISKYIIILSKRTEPKVSFR